MELSVEDLNRRGITEKRGVEKLFKSKYGNIVLGGVFQGLHDWTL